MTRKELVLLTVRLALPAILAQVSSVVMQFADSAMVGRMGAVDSAAIGLIGSSSWLINSVTMSLGTGFMVQVAHRIGAQEARKARDVVKHGLLFSLAFCLLMTVFAEAIRDQLEATESFDGLLGHMSIDPANHNPSRDAAIFRVDAEEVTYVGIYDPEAE